MKPRPESWTVHATQKQKNKCYRASYPFIDFVCNSSRDLGEVNDLRSLGNRQDEHREPATAERNRGYRGPLSSFHNRCNRLNSNVEGLLAPRVCDPRPLITRREDASRIVAGQREFSLQPDAGDAGEPKLVNAGHSHSLGSVQINLGLVVTTKPGRRF